jgi:GNAT superfamily N-acetyltransferase
MDVRLSEDDDYYLTWMSYPYLKPEQKARLMRVAPSARSYEPLSTTIYDSQGQSYEMRGAASPREVARLAWLMRQSGLTVPSHPENEILVLVAEHGVIAGGILFWAWDEEHVWIQGVVVSPHFRGRDLGRAMVEDLLSRLEGRGVRVVTVDFLLPSFWTHLGFEANAAYGGLTRILGE